MVEWIISSSLLILVVTAVRFAFRGKVSLRLQYALWALVLVRLLVPFSLFASPVSAANLAPAQVIADTRIELPALHAEKIYDSIPATASDIKPTADTAAPALNAQSILCIVWLCGIGVTAAVLTASNVSFALKLRRTRRRLDCDCLIPVYECENLPTPCMLMGAIYVTGEVAGNKQKLRHVLAHEYTHYRHGDGVWSLLRCVCLALHWYNPLVWWAASLSKRDAELACDEGAIRAVGEGERMDYGCTLIELTAKTVGAKDLLCCATTMTGGRKNIKERIELIATKPKNIITTVIAVVLICAIAAGCSFGGASADPVDEIEESIVFTTGDNQVVTMSYTVPKGVASLNAVGRYVDDSGSGYSFHDELDAAKGAHDGYIANFMDFTELYMEVVLENGKNGEIDLLQHYKEAGMPLRGSTNMYDGTITFNVEGTEETVPAQYYSIDDVAILMPTEGWECENTEGSAEKTIYVFHHTGNQHVMLTFKKYADCDNTAALKDAGDNWGVTFDVQQRQFGSGVAGIYGTAKTTEGDTIGYYGIEHNGNTYAAMFSIPQGYEEGWGSRLEAISQTLCFLGTTPYAPTGLTADTTVGVGVLLDYADDHTVIFHGYFGLFVYDLDRQQIIGVFDLQKTVGSTNVQGSEGAGVEVSSDGKTILLYHYVEDGAPDKAVYINTDNMSCSRGVYKALADPFKGVEDMSHPEMSYSDAPYIRQTGDTLGDLVYVNHMEWSLFENYFGK